MNPYEWNNSRVTELQRRIFFKKKSTSIEILESFAKNDVDGSMGGMIAMLAPVMLIIILWTATVSLTETVNLWGVEPDPFFAIFDIC